MQMGSQREWTEIMREKLCRAEADLTPGGKQKALCHHQVTDHNPEFYMKLTYTSLVRSKQRVIQDGEKVAQQLFKQNKT